MRAEDGSSCSTALDQPAFALKFVSSMRSRLSHEPCCDHHTRCSAWQHALMGYCKPNNTGESRPAMRGVQAAKACIASYLCAQQRHSPGWLHVAQAVLQGHCLPECIHSCSSVVVQQRQPAGHTSTVGPGQPHGWPSACTRGIGVLAIYGSAPS
jgi:hypothetical protein